MELSWKTENPYFTQCFEDTVLVWIPCGFLWLFIPMDIYYANTAKAYKIDWNVLNVSKSLICVLLTILQLILLYPALFPPENHPEIYPVELLTPAVKSVTYVRFLLTKICRKLRAMRFVLLQFTRFKLYCLLFLDFGPNHTSIHETQRCSIFRCSVRILVSTTFL